MLFSYIPARRMREEVGFEEDLQVSVSLYEIIVLT